MSAVVYNTTAFGSSGITVRHPQVRHSVQCRAPHQQLRCLSLKAASTNALTEDHLHAKDLRLGQRAAVVIALSLPLSTPGAADGTQILIADVPLSFRVSMLPDARSLLRRDRRSCSSASDRLIAVAAVVGSIGRDLANLVLDLREQVFEQLRVLERVGRDDNGHKLSGRLIHAEMEFAPCASARVTVLAHFPLTLAIDFDTCGVYHHVERLRLRATRQLNLQRAAATRERRVTGHAQLDAEQADDRARQSFGGAQRQAINFFQSRHAQDGRVGIVSRLAALARAGRVVPRLKNIFTDPDGQTSALDKSFVILTPVTETVSLLGFLFCHTSKIPAAPSP